MRISMVGLVVSCLYVASGLAETGSSAASNTPDINAQNANNVCRVYFSTPKPGAGQQYEAGRKKHMQFHRDQKDTWTWNTFFIETGDNAGTYVTSSCGHAWKDFDEWEARMGKADTADAATNMSPFVQSGRNGFYVYRSDMSLAPANQPAAPLTAVTVFVLHPGAGPDFIASIKKVNDALSKQADWPKTSGWLQLVAGGEGPTFFPEDRSRLHSPPIHRSSCVSRGPSLCAREMMAVVCMGARTPRAPILRALERKNTEFKV